MFKASYISNHGDQFFLLFLDVAKLSNSKSMSSSPTFSKKGFMLELANPDGAALPTDGDVENDAADGETAMVGAGPKGVIVTGVVADDC